MIGFVTSYLEWIAIAGRRTAVFAASAIALALLPATAIAADPATHQYADGLDQVSPGGVAGSPGAGAAPGSTGSTTGDLPFTGLDLALLAAAAAVLVISGLLLRRLRPGSRGASA